MIPTHLRRRRRAARIVARAVLRRAEARGREADLGLGVGGDDVEQLLDERRVGLEGERMVLRWLEIYKLAQTLLWEHS